MDKLRKFPNGTKVPDFPVTIGTDISARVFATDWGGSNTKYWARYPPKAFDGVFGSNWQSVFQNEDVFKITFDQPQARTQFDSCFYCV